MLQYVANEVRILRSYLIDRRKKAGMTQHNVAVRLNMSRQYYSLIERGERKQEMNISLLCKLAEIFGVPVSELIAAEREFLK